MSIDPRVILDDVPLDDAPLDEDVPLDEGLSARVVSSVARLRRGRAPVPSLGQWPGTWPRDAIARLYHVDPPSLVRRLRFDIARRALLETTRDESSIARQVGVSSVRALGILCRQRTGMTPAAYRRLRGARAFELTLPRWLAIPPLLRYWGRDPRSLTEQVDGRVIRLGMTVGRTHRPILVEVELAGRRARCSLVHPRRPPATAAIEAHRILVRMLGIDSDPRPFERAARAVPAMAALVGPRRGLVVPRTRDVFEAVLWVIAGQQVSLAAAFAMRRRLIARVGAPIGDGLHAPPTPAAVAALDASDLRDASFSVRKAEYVLAAARDIVEGRFVTETDFAVAPTLERALLARRGFGPWSVGYLMMRAWGFADCVPVGDAALVRRLAEVHGLDDRPDADHTLRLMRPYAPYRSLATFHYWSSGASAQ